MTIFSVPGGDRIEISHAANLLPQDGEVYLIEDAMTPAYADQAFEQLLETIDWRQEHAKLFGRQIPLPRLTAWYGERGYSYSGIHHEPAPFTPALLALKALAERLANARINSVLINLYRHGRDSMGWHSDNEPSLGDEPEIVSLSLGEARRFQLKHRKTDELISLNLPHGSFLIMRGRCQTSWRHQLPKTTKAVGARINLTFRTIYL